jgi:hypothetical protein
MEYLNLTQSLKANNKNFITFANIIKKTIKRFLKKVYKDL